MEIEKARRTAVLFIVRLLSIVAFVHFNQLSLSPSSVNGQRIDYDDANALIDEVIRRNDGDLFQAKGKGKTI